MKSRSSYKNGKVHPVLGFLLVVAAGLGIAAFILHFTNKKKCSEGFNSKGVQAGDQAGKYGCTNSGVICDDNDDCNGTCVCQSQGIFRKKKCGVSCQKLNSQQCDDAIRDKACCPRNPSSDLCKKCQFPPK